MKYIYNLLILFLSAASCLLIGCKDNEEPADPNMVMRLSLEGLPDNRVTMLEEESYQLKVSVLPGDATDKEEYKFEYVSNNDTIVSVNEQGIITALAPGEATININALNNTDLWTLCKVVVDERFRPVTSVVVPEKYKALTFPAGCMFDLGSKVSFLPLDATFSLLDYTCNNEKAAVVTNDGKIYTQGVGDAIITIGALDGSKTAEKVSVSVKEIAGYKDLERAGWEVLTSHATPSDASAKGEAECLIDGNTSSCLILVKPEKTFGGITVGKESIWFLINMGKQTTFDCFRLNHRTTNASAFLRVKQVALYGSDDGKSFDLIKGNIDINTNISEVGIELLEEYSYQYVKVEITDWDRSNGSTVQIAEFNIGTVLYK